MGSSCCKEIKIHSNNTLTSNTNKNYMTWIKGDQIGKGVFSTVYKAIDTETASIFAVKSISLKPKSQEFSKLISNVRQEVDILKTLDHPNIIKFYQTDIDIETNHIHIICEYAPNGDLLSFIKQFHPLPLNIVRKFTKEILTAVEYIHSKGIIHRDLKCVNLLIDRNSVIKLTDFGLSCCISKSQKGVYVGTPYWMAPEVLLGNEHTKASDIWSFACTVVEMLNSTLPWSKFAKTQKELAKLITKTESFLVLPKHDEKLENFLKLCFDLNPKNRPSASELLSHEFLAEKQPDHASGTAQISDL